MLFVGLIIYHIAVAKVAPPLKDLPTNLRDGFYITFKFDTIGPDSDEIKAQSATALGKCDVVTSSCPNPGNPNPLSKTSSTGTEKARILAIFESTLGVVRKVCNDKYFGTEDLAKVGDDLNDVMGNISSISAAGMPCIGSNPLYCNIWGRADSIKNAVGDVTKEIDKFIDSDLVKEYQKEGDKLVGLHALPYILVISALFFFGFWWRGGQCWCWPCCTGGSKLGCIYIFPHIIFWLVFFIINSIIVGAGIFLKFFSEEVKVDFLKGKPNLKEFLDHVKTTYPEFWNKVFADMEEGLDFMWHAALVFHFFCIIIVSYGCCMCCCRPYKEPKDTGKVADELA